MPVTFTVASHPANPVHADGSLNDAEGLLQATWGRASLGSATCSELLQSTFSRSNTTDFSAIVPDDNGFLRTVIRACNHHHHLVLRPDDVWIAILGQFNFYVNAHAEELREHFVAHKGKKSLVVRAVGNRYSVDFGSLARQMTGLIDQNVVDKDLRAWILPDFSTTTHNDTVVSSVLMMATLKAYFSYEIVLECGIPSVTLEGERADWEKLLTRIDKLSSFGSEPTAWARLLRPILTRFVSSFDGSPDLDFWSKICHYESLSGSDSVSGWITAFAVWTTGGKWQGPHLSGAVHNVPDRMKLDDVQYAYLDTSRIPTGYCEVDVLLNDNGEEFDCMMVSGLVGQLAEGEGKDTVRPLPAWFMFIKESTERPDAGQLAEGEKKDIVRPLPAWLKFIKGRKEKRRDA